MEGLSAQELVELLRLQNGNLEIVLSEEPYLNDALLYMASALAWDCMDWEEPSKAKEGNLMVLEPAARYAGLFREEWFPEPRMLVLGPETERTEEDMSAMVEKGRILRSAILDRHLDAFGRDSQDSVMKAYRETNTCMVYMIAAGCARSNDLEGSLGYVRRLFASIADLLIESRT